MQALIDFLPIAAFAIAFWLRDLHTAIFVIMVATVAQVAVTWLITRTVHRMTLISAVLVVVIGGVSLLLNNELIFKWKPTILYWVLAVVFIGSQFIGDKPMGQRLLQSVFKEEVTLPERDRRWRILNLVWVVFFLILGAANLYVAYNFSETIWVNFKVFGLTILTVVFLVAQVLWLARHAPSGTTSQE